MKRPTIAPRVPDVTPPSRAPGKPLVDYASLIGAPTTLDQAGISGPSAAPSKGPLELDATGTAPLRLQRNESSAAVLTVIAIKRHGTTIGFVGLDASDHIVVLASDGTTVLATIKSPSEVDASHFVAATDVKTPKVLDGSGNQVVGARQAAIANVTATSGSSGPGGGTGGPAGNPATLGDVDGAYSYADGAYAIAEDAKGTALSLVTAFNTLLAEIRTHGLIAP